MKVRMKLHLTGTRNGVRWPAAGEVKELPDNEALDLLNAGLAEAVVEDKPKVEKATPRKASEKR